MYECADLLALYELCEVALLVHVEHDDRHVALTAECERCLVHDLEAVLDCLVKAEFLILDCRRILLRVCSLDSVNSCTLEEGIRSDFKRTESST